MGDPVSTALSAGRYFKVSGKLQHTLQACGIASLLARPGVISDSWMIAGILRWNNTAGYQQLEYANQELSDLFAASDFVISRAGANAICELLALRKPNILIPLSAHASRGDQILNARSFESQGYSMVIEEEKLDDVVMMDKIKKLWNQRSHYIHAMENSKQLNSVETVVRLIDDAAKKS